MRLRVYSLFSAIVCVFALSLAAAVAVLSFRLDFAFAKDEAKAAEAVPPLLSESDLRLLSYEQNTISLSASPEYSEKLISAEAELVRKLEKATQDMAANTLFRSSEERFEQLISIWSQADRGAHDLLKRMLKIGELNPKIYETRGTKPPLHYNSARAMLQAYESALRYAANSQSPVIREKALSSLTALIERTQGDPVALERMGQWINVSDWTRYQTSNDVSTRTTVERSKMRQTPEEKFALQKLNAAYEKSYQILKSGATCFEFFRGLK